MQQVIRLILLAFLPSCSYATNDVDNYLMMLTTKSYYNSVISRGKETGTYIIASKSDDGGYVGKIITLKNGELISSHEKKMDTQEYFKMEKKFQEFQLKSLRYLPAVGDSDCKNLPLFGFSYGTVCIKRIEGVQVQSSILSKYGNASFDYGLITFVEKYDEHLMIAVSYCGNSTCSIELNTYKLIE